MELKNLVSMTVTSNARDYTLHMPFGAPHGEIYDAIASLTPAQRKYVYARFWHGMTTAEMKAEVFGYDPSALWNSAKNGAKRKLAEQLGFYQATGED